MALLIDGYNLLHVTSLFGQTGPGLEGSRQALLDFLAAALSERQRRETMIVFDAAGAPPGLPGELAQDGLRICFARRYTDADAMIEELLEAHAAPRSLLVVSSDHRVQRAARGRGAAFIDSDRWYRELVDAHRGTVPTAQPAAKPVGELSPDQVAYWTAKFSEPLPAAESPGGRSASLPGGRSGSGRPEPTSGAVPPARKRSARQESDARPDAADLANPFPPGYAEDLLRDDEEGE